MTSLVKLAALLAAVLVLAVAPAAEANRSVPQQFMGVNWDGPMVTAPQALQEKQLARMASVGVESVRTPFFWAVAQPDQNGPISLAATDRFMAMASRHRVRVLPTVILAPEWARTSPEPLAPPRDPHDFQPYVNALVARYGPHGSFWSDHPGLPKLPIHYWQFWNEPHLQFQWTVGPGVDWRTTYVAALKVFHSTIKAADPHAKVVLAGLSNQSPEYLNQLYKFGARRYFDVATIHPYTAQPGGVVTLVKRFRQVMKHRGDARKPLWVTELGLPAAKGHSPSGNGLQTTARGMARFLTRSYRELAAGIRDRRIKATRVYFYTWASEYRGEIFRYTGLFGYGAGGRLTAQPAYAAYRAVARRLEGCVKTTGGSCRH